jgi:hypothetical protein
VAWWLTWLRRGSVTAHALMCAPAALDVSVAALSRPDAIRVERSAGGAKVNGVKAANHAGGICVCGNRWLLPLLISVG